MIEISINETGLKEITAALKQLERAGVRGGRIVYEGHARHDNSENTNAEIMEKLIKRGADFFSLGNDRGNVVQTVADKLTSRLQLEMNRKEGLGKSTGHGILIEALMAGGKKLTDEVVRRMNAQETANGSAPSPKNNEEYDRKRQSKYGVPIGVVGKATADLLNSFAKGGRWKAKLSK